MHGINLKQWKYVKFKELLIYKLLIINRVVKSCDPKLGISIVSSWVVAVVHSRKVVFMW